MVAEIRYEPLTDDYHQAFAMEQYGRSLVVDLCLNCGALVPRDARRTHTRFHERLNGLAVGGQE